MPKGQLYINGVDAYETWGMSLSSTGLAALLTPAPNKSYVTNKSRQEHGTRLLADNAKVDERNVTLQFHITAPNYTAFYRQYKALMDVLAAGVFEIWTSLNPDETYRMYYQSCSQFGEYGGRTLAKFTLKLIEPDPTNRATERSRYPHLKLDRDRLDDQYSQLI